MSSHPNHILDYYASIHADGLHARGQIATNKILDLLHAQSSDKLLEIGIGTGNTLVQTFLRYPGVELHGIEPSENMILTARQRLQWCGIKNISLHQSIHTLPAHYFDVVYAESVLAIQEGDALEGLIQQIRRVLKPGGRLLFNETIWLTHTSLETIQSINHQCKIAFGIIQANASYPYINDWVSLLEKNGLQPISLIKVDDLPHKASWSWHPPTIHSKLFTWWGKARHWFLPVYRRHYQTFRRSMQQLVVPSEKTMEGIIGEFKFKV